VNFCIQDPSASKTFLLSDYALKQFEADESTDVAADVLFVCPSDSLLQEIPPPARLSNSDRPVVQIVDSDKNKSWVIDYSNLEKMEVAAPPQGKDVVWFAMPKAKEVMAAIPMFRRALVQHGS
jgi:hypothetical protein